MAAPSPCRKWREFASIFALFLLANIPGARASEEAGGGWADWVAKLAPTPTNTPTNNATATTNSTEGDGAVTSQGMA
jgi:hypothetical protein